MLLLLLIISIILTVLSRIDLLYNTKALSLDEIYELADTGDIIYYRWKYIWFGQDLITPFTHTGLVVAHPMTKQKFVIETHLAGDTKNIGIYTGGINVYPLKLRLSTYSGTTFLTKLKNKPNNDDVLSFLTKLTEYKERIPFYEKYVQYFVRNCLTKRLFNHKTDFEAKEGMFCSEFVGFSLKELKVIPKSVEHSCLTPDDFRYIKDEKGEYLYKDLIRIKVSS
jgi:hypothetical protein